MTGSGPAGIAAAAADFRIGREGDGLVQPLSVTFTIEGLEPDTRLECCPEEDYRDLGDGREYLACCRQACESGKLPAAVNIVRLYQTGRKDGRMVNATQPNRVFPLDPRSLADAECELRTQARQVVRFRRINDRIHSGLQREKKQNTVGGKHDPSDA